MCVMHKDGRPSPVFVEMDCQRHSMMKKMAKVPTSESASIVWHGVEMGSGMRNRIDMIAVRNVVDVRRCMWDEDTSRKNTPVCRMRHQMPVRRCVWNRINVVPVSYVVDVGRRVRYRVTMGVGHKYLCRCGLSC